VPRDSRWGLALGLCVVAALAIIYRGERTGDAAASTIAVRAFPTAPTPGGRTRLKPALLTGREKSFGEPGLGQESPAEEVGRQRQSPQEKNQE
jgi:hypothetical protein